MKSKAKVTPAGGLEVDGRQLFADRATKIALDAMRSIDEEARQDARLFVEAAKNAAQRQMREQVMREKAERDLAEARRELDQLRVEHDEVLVGLIELVKLQAHYATLLNMHDGGERHAFASAAEWMARLRELAAIQSREVEPQTPSGSEGYSKGLKNEGITL